MEQNGTTLTEPWLRNTLNDVSAGPRAVLHALELAREDLKKWAGDLTDDELNQRPFGIPPIAFHLRHIARSLDRLLSYAEGRLLAPEQIALLQAELVPEGKSRELFDELSAALDLSARRIRRLAAENFDSRRQVGSKQLPTTLGGLLVHAADHTQRHVGQAITTAKIVLATRKA